MKYRFFILLPFLFLSVSLDAQKKKTVQEGFDATKRPKDLSDSALLDLVQKQTFR